MSPSSRRVPRAIVTACSPAVAQIRIPTASPSSTSAGKPRRPPGRSTVRGSESTSKSCIPWRARTGNASSRRAVSAGRSSSRSAFRDRPEASAVPSSASIEKFIRRCAGRSSSDQSAALIRTPRSRSIASASTARSAPERGVTLASSSVAVSGIGTSGVRSRFGRLRRSATTSSLRNAGTSHSKLVSCTAPSDASGMWTVTPSAAEPGSKR